MKSYSFATDPITGSATLVMLSLIAASAMRFCSGVKPEFGICFGQIPGVCLIGPVVQVTYVQQVLRRISFIERGFHSLGQRKAQGIAGGIPSAVGCNLIRKPTPEQFFYQRIVGPVTVRGVRDDHLFAPFNIRLHLVRKGFGVFIRNPVVLEHNLP